MAHIIEPVGGWMKVEPISDTVGCVGEDAETNTTECEQKSSCVKGEKTSYDNTREQLP